MRDRTLIAAARGGPGDHLTAPPDVRQTEAQTHRRGGAEMRLSVVMTLLLLPVLGGQACGSTDPWAFGAKPEEWALIEAIQRCPLYEQEKAIDWAGALGHKNPIVRAAAVLALGREVPPGLDYAKSVEALARDSEDLVRCCALWSLSYRPTPTCRPAVLEAARTYGGAFYLIQFAGRSRLETDRLLSQLELPTEVARGVRVQREFWQSQHPEVLREANVNKPVIPPDRSKYPLDVYACLERSVLPANAEPSFRVKAVNHGSETIASPPRPRSVTYLPCDVLSLLGPEFWRHDHGRSINQAGQPASIPPGQLRIIDVSLEHPPLATDVRPDVYFAEMMLDQPLFIRFTRSEAAEREVDRWVGDVRNAIDKTRGHGLPGPSRVIAENHVRAAVPMLMEYVQKAVGDPSRMPPEEVFGMLTGIGDTSCFPQLMQLARSLDEKNWLVRDQDFVGMALSPLKADRFAANDLYCREILQWRQNLDEGRSRLLKECVELCRIGSDTQVATAAKEFTIELIARMAAQPQWATDADRSGLFVGLLRSISDHDADWVARTILRCYAECPSAVRWRDDLVKRLVITGVPRAVEVGRCLWPMCQGDVPGAYVIRAHVGDFLRRNDPGPGMLRPPLTSQEAGTAR